MKTIKILGYNYSLDGVDSDMFEPAGRCKMGAQQIEYDQTMHKQQQASTVFHEIIEALNYHLYLGLTEGQIMGMEAGLFQVLEENGISLDKLVSEEK